MVVIIGSFAVQQGRGATVVYMRRGWDFGMHYTLQTMHQDETFRDACDSAGSPDAADGEDLFSGPFFQSLDRHTGHVWSRRTSSEDAGMYALGAQSVTMPFIWFRSLLVWSMPRQPDVVCRCRWRSNVQAHESFVICHRYPSFGRGT